MNIIIFIGNVLWWRHQTDKRELKFIEYQNNLLGPKTINVVNVQRSPIIVKCGLLLSTRLTRMRSDVVLGFTEENLQRRRTKKMYKEFPLFVKRILLFNLASIFNDLHVGPRCWLTVCSWHCCLTVCSYLSVATLTVTPWRSARGPWHASLTCSSCSPSHGSTWSSSSWAWSKSWCPQRPNVQLVPMFPT